MLRKKIDLVCISNSRLFLFGIATLLVLFFHSTHLVVEDVVKNTLLVNILNFIKKTGNFGVDLFLLLSGFGLFFSCSKNSIKSFYKKRFIRVFPAFLIVIVFYAMITKTMTFIDVLESLFFVSFFIKGNLDVWFIPFILIMYLVFPIIYKIINNKDLYGLITLLFISVLLNLVLSILFPIYYNRIELALTRIPVFLIGVYLGKLVYLKKKIPLYLVLISVFFQVIILLLLYLNIDIEHFNVFTRYFYCILAFCSVINVSCLFLLFKNKKNIIVRIIEFFGIYSLEIYLLFEKIVYILMKFFNSEFVVLFYLFCFLITLFTAIVLKKIVNVLVLIFDKTNKLIYS